MRTDGLFADLLQVVRFLRVYRVSAFSNGNYIQIDNIEDDSSTFNGMEVCFFIFQIVDAW